MTLRLERRRAVVTGAASGIGAAVARRMAEEGAHVVAVDIDAERLRDEHAGTEGVTTHVADVRGPEALAAFTVAGPTDILVNASGVLRRHDVLAHPRSAWDETLSINLTAAFRLSREFARQAIDAGRRGSIVNVASIEGFVALPGHAAYTASKAGIVALTKAFALELAPRGIRVNAIAPGVTKTAMNADVRADPERSAQLLSEIPMRRYGDAYEQAAAVAFLASDEASYVTGAVLAVDGGWLTA